VELPVQQPYFNVVDLKNSPNTTTLRKLAEFNQLQLKIVRDFSDTTPLNLGRITTANFERVIKMTLGLRSDQFGFAVACFHPTHRHLVCKNFKVANLKALEDLFPQGREWYCIISVYDPKCELGLVMKELVGMNF
jgi:hypothetical protein